MKRWIILALLILGGYAAWFGPSILKPISPVVVLPGEPTGLAIGGLTITNTMLATLLADVLLILLAISAVRFERSGKTAPSGIYNAFEAIVEYLWNTVEGAAGSKWARRIFALTATIFLLVFVANMVKMVPGFESIGYLKERHEGTGYAPVALFNLGGATVYTIDKGQPVEVEVHGEGEAAEGEHAAEAEGEHSAEAGGVLCKACEVVPFFRGSATDLNFTFALAVITVVMTQVYGAWALGAPYFEKYFQVRQIISGGIFGLINFAVGILEIVLEFAKILSFGFRLFGNIFAGALLLSIVGALLPVALPAGLYLFEVFFGVIQAYVFFLLATMFTSGATVSHHAEEHH
ncbi:MAG: F0F1 ATP synthase subunit A [Chloroflexi bacterium]|nr:F0F1 ATP synthase subunit A [Chloroflexota bacterium]